MNEELIRLWNNKVPAKDSVVFHLGDFGFGSPQELLKIRERLNGQIFIIRGNHDKQFINKTFGWEKDYYELNVQGTNIVMSHYPMLVWNKSHRGSIMLSGHTHESNRLVRPDHRGIHVGVDAWGYEPVSINQIIHLANTIKVKEFPKNG